MIRYKIEKKKSPRTGTVKYYVAVAPTTPVSRKDIISQIEKQTSLSSADVKSCLDALEYVVIEALKQGNAVRLGDLGSFRPTITSFGTTEQDKADAQLIRGVRCRFTMSGNMRLALQPERLNFAPYRNIKLPTEGGE